MKKTIAILLVLVIGMVGVFAIDTSLYLATTIDAVNQMVVVPTGTTLDGYSWPGTNGASNLMTNGVGATAANALILDSSYQSLDKTTYKPVAKLFARSNDRVGVDISVDSLPLRDTTTYAHTTPTEDTLNIDYSLKVGTVVIGYTDGVQDSTTSSSLVVGSLSYTDAGIDSDEWDIGLLLSESLVNAAAGTYVANVTFTFTANT